MELKRTLLVIVLMSTAAFVLAISGCSRRGGSSMDSPGSWNNNFKCTAVSGYRESHPSIGWSTSKSTAKANALDKCRVHSANPDSCRILNCVNDRAAS